MSIKNNRAPADHYSAIRSAISTLRRLTLKTGSGVPEAIIEGFN